MFCTFRDSGKEQQLVVTNQQCYIPQSCAERDSGFTVMLCASVSRDKWLPSPGLLAADSPRSRLDLVSVSPRVRLDFDPPRTNVVLRAIASYCSREPNDVAGEESVESFDSESIWERQGEPCRLAGVTGRDSMLTVRTRFCLCVCR